MNPPAKPGKDDDGTRDRILAAARKEFIENGLRGARMQEIADRAGANKALLHYHFRDKAGLYQAVLGSIVDLVKSSIEEVELPEPGPGSAETTIRRLVHAYMTVLRNHPECVGMFLRELSDGGQNLAPLVEAIAPMAKRLFLGVHQQIVENGSTPRVDPVHILMNLFSMVWGTFLLRPMYSRILPAAGIMDRFDDAFLEERCRAIAQTVILSTSSRTA
ncbi:MAG: TetR/AcrR family transcriptional regulator [Fibrobacteria bacterium]|nr:TetR/AcrR family transcriptional regulator [Fibrobacteria bacterium]